MIEEAPIPIVYQDEHLVVVHKPAGLLVHRSELDKYETRFAMQVVRDQLGQSVYTVHRLDKPTSGLLIFALHQEAARQMSQAFAEGLVEKHYQAIVRGYLGGDDVLDYPLTPEKEKWDKGKSYEPQEAVTHYKQMAQVELPFAVGRYETARYSLVELKPLTGRRHQLRRHMAHLRHPIVGDSRHGDGAHNRFFREELGIGRLLLQARYLKFKHPITEKLLTLEAKEDKSFDFAKSRLGFLDLN